MSLEIECANGSLGVGSIERLGIVNIHSEWYYTVGKDSGILTVDTIEHRGIKPEYSDRYSVCFYDDKGRYGELVYSDFIDLCVPVTEVDKPVDDTISCTDIITDLESKSNNELLFMASIIRLILDSRGVSYPSRQAGVEEYLMGDKDE